MRVVNMGEFLSLPAGTIYSGYDGHWDLDGLKIKLSVQGDCSSEWDWVYCDMIDTPDYMEGNSWDNMQKAIQAGKSFKMDMGRDGGMRAQNYEETNEQFAVYDRSDLQRLIDRLTEVLPVAPVS